MPGLALTADGAADLGAATEQSRSAGVFEVPAGAIELAADFGVSRGPVRSALQVLEGEGLVETLTSGGMVSVGFSVDDLASLFRVRHLLEAAAVRYGV